MLYPMPECPDCWLYTGLSSKQEKYLAKIREFLDGQCLFRVCAAVPREEDGCLGVEKLTKLSELYMMRGSEWPAGAVGGELRDVDGSVVVG